MTTTEARDQLWLVAGLGNPGPGYAGNRHNAGFMVVDLLAARVGGKFKSHKARADVVEGRLGVGGPRVVLAKPKTFMNLSGGPVKALRDFYKIGRRRLESATDHRRARRTRRRLRRAAPQARRRRQRPQRAALHHLARWGPRNTYRVRFGIGRPPGRQDPADFVLKDFSSTEKKDLDYNVDRAADAVEDLIRRGLVEAQNIYHAA